MNIAFSTFCFQNNKMWSFLWVILPPPAMISARAQALLRSLLLYPCPGSHQAELLLCHPVTSELCSQASGVLSLSLASGTTGSLSLPGSCVGTLTPGARPVSGVCSVTGAPAGWVCTACPWPQVESWAPAFPSSPAQLICHLIMVLPLLDLLA